jgi:hypothetical protein
LTLTEDLPLSWEQYLAVEEDLDAILALRDAPLGQRLIMQSAYLRLLINLLRESRRQSGELLAEPEANSGPLEVFRRRMRGIDADPWLTVRRLATRRGASPLLRRMFLGFAHAIHRTYNGRRGRLRSYFMATSAYLLYSIGRGRFELPGGRGTVPYARLRRVRFEPSRPEMDELLTRYFRHRLFRKDLIQGDSIQVAHPLLLMHWGLIHWHGAALAAADGVNEVTADHLAEALRMVEKLYVYHSTFDRAFTRYPVLRGCLERIYEHPLYAFSMGYRE